MTASAPHLHPSAFSDDGGVPAFRSSWIVQIFSVSSAFAQTRIARLLSIATDLHVEEVSNGRKFYVVTECADHRRAQAIWAFVGVIDPGAQLEHQVDGVGSLEVVAERLATRLPRELL